MVCTLTKNLKATYAVKITIFIIKIISSDEKKTQLNVFKRN